MSAAGVGDVLVLGVGVGVGVAGLVALTELPPPVVGVGVGELLALVALGVLAGSVALGVLVALVALAVGVALGELAAGLALEELAVGLAVELAVPDADGVAVADGELAAKAVPVMPLVMTKRPVARPTVTGRECADRMRTPCLSSVVATAVGKRTLRDVVSFGWLELSYGHRCSYSTPKPALDATPAPHITPNRFRLIARRHTRTCRPGRRYQA
jgi:hypothetical protein